MLRMLYCRYLEPTMKASMGRTMRHPQVWYSTGSLNEFSTLSLSGARAPYVSDLT